MLVVRPSWAYRETATDFMSPALNVLDFVSYFDYFRLNVCLDISTFVATAEVTGLLDLIWLVRSVSIECWSAC